MNFIKKIKLEVFFIFKLFNPTITPVCAFSLKCYLNYFKNRFFGYYLLRKFRGYFFYGSFDDLELHILCQKSDIWIMAWALYSFLYFSRLKPSAIIIHDDGSLDEKIAGVLALKFSNLEVLPRNKADKMIHSMNLPSEILKIRSGGHILMLKLIDIFLLSRAGNILVIDSDVLFFKKPVEIVDFIGQESKQALASSGLENGKPQFNSGLLIMKKHILKLEVLLEYFKTLPEIDRFFVEQDGWDFITSRAQRELLDPVSYKIKGRVEKDTVMKHYTSPRRQEMFACGIDKARENIAKNPLI